MTLARRLWRLLVSWAKRFRNSSSCLSSSGARLSDAMALESVHSLRKRGKLPNESFLRILKTVSLSR